MKFKALKQNFSICKISDISMVDFSRDFVFLSKTESEISLVCESEYVPKNATHIEPHWRAFQIDGVLDFSLVGIVAGATKKLAEKGISVFVISTYNTDYFLVKSENFDKAFALL